MLKEYFDAPAGVQVLEAAGTVTAADYRQVFAPLVDRARRMRLLYHFGPGFQRITPGALWQDTRLGLRYARLLDGCAIVTDITWIATPTRRIGAWMPCPVQVFGNDGRDEAIAWLASLPECAEVSASGIAKAYLGGVGGALGGFGELAISLVKNRHAAR